MIKTSNKSASLRDICNRIWRARWKILWYQAAVAIIALLVIFLWPRKYSSAAKLFFPVGRESVGLDPTATTTGQTIALQQSGRDEEIISAIEVILSRGVLGPVVDKLTPEVVLGSVSVGEEKANLLGDLVKSTVGAMIEAIRNIDPSPPRERAIIKIEKNLNVRAERKSLAVEIAFESESSELSQLVVQAIVDEYRSLHLRLHQTEGSEQFFQEQSQRLRTDLMAAANKLKESKNEMGLASVLGQRKILEDQLSETRGDSFRTGTQLAQAQAALLDLKKQLAERPDRIISSETLRPNGGADMQSSQLFALQIKEQELLARFNEKHPELKMVRDQVRKAKEQMDSQNETNRAETSFGIDKVHQELTLIYLNKMSEEAGLEARKYKLEEQDAILVSEIKKLNENEVEIEQLAREVEVAEKKFQNYAANLEEAHVDQALRLSSMSSVTIAQAATLQRKPVSPSKGLTIIFAAMLAVAGTVIIAFLSARFDDTLDDRDSVQRQLHLPVLGTVPKSDLYGRILT